MSDPYDEILERVMTGELDEDSEEFRQALRERPDLAERLALLRELQRTLDTMGEFERCDRAGEEPVPDQVVERLDQTIRGYLRPRRRSPWPALLAVAAALLAVGLVWLLATGGRGNGSDPDRDRMRLDHGHRMIPNEELGSHGFAVFDWSALDFGAGGRFRYVLRIYASNTEDEPLIEPVETTATSWRPDDAVTSAWPDRIFYTLEVLDAAGAQKGLESAHAIRED